MAFASTKQNENENHFETLKMLNLSLTDNNQSGWGMLASFRGRELNIPYNTVKTFNGECVIVKEAQDTYLLR